MQDIRMKRNEIIEKQNIFKKTNEKKNKYLFIEMNKT